MNNTAKKIGLNNTNFVTPHGLDDENHYTTAYELALLTNYALKNETFKQIVNTKVATININNSTRQICNTNELLGYLEGVNGVKTGFTNGAGRCLVTSCTRGENQIITVVLGCDTKKQRTSDSAKLIEYAFNNYTRVNIENLAKKEFENWKQINLKRIYINKAKTNNIEVELADIKKKQIPVKNGEEKDITIEIVNNVNDIAGIRIICPLKSDIFKVREIIEKVTDMQIIKEKDYITNPKKSGYSSYHIIVKTPIIYNGEKLFVKVEIQIRTMAMDFWATFEHKTKYKTNKNIPANVSKKLVRYAKMLNSIENKMIKLYESNK